MGGVIPPLLVTSLTTKELSRLTDVRLKFEKAAHIDSSVLRNTVALIRSDSTPVTPAEESLFQEGTRLFSRFEGKKAERVKMDTPLTIGKMAYHEGSSSALAYASTFVRASSDEVLAHIWNANRRGSMYLDEIERSIDEVVSPHNKLIYVRKQVIKPLEDRDFLSRMLWKQTTPSNYLHVAITEENAARPRMRGVVRATFSSATKIISIGPHMTKLEFVVHPDFQGAVPLWAMKFYIPENLSAISKYQRHFLSQVPLADMTAEDGRALGEEFLRKKEANNSGVNASERVRAMFKKVRACHTLV